MSCFPAELFGNKATHPFTNFVSHTAKDRHPFLITADVRRGRVLEALMNAPGLSGKNGTALVCVVAHGNDVIELLPHKLINCFRAVLGYVDTELTHYLNCFRPHGARLHAGALHFEFVSAVVTQNPLRHLTSCGVSRAENQDTLLILWGVHAWSPSGRPLRASTRTQVYKPLARFSSGPVREQ